MRKFLQRASLFSSLAFVCIALIGCGDSKVIVSGIDEREANIVVVFLDSKGIVAHKEKTATGPGAAAGEATIPKYNISVESGRAIDAMALLNSNGLPHQQGTNLLELFAKQGLMSTDKEETIRYQAGLASQLSNMILMIDGVIDASVQLSFPTSEAGTEEAQREQVTAAVFIKHQGIFDDPNAHLESKIKRLVAGSVNGLDINDVTVVSDRSRFTDITPSMLPDAMKRANAEYVRIWSMVMSKESASKFRFVFFLLLALAILLSLVIAWLIWKVYPIIKSQGGLNELFNPLPLLKRKEKKKEKEDSLDHEEHQPPHEL